MLYVCQTFSSVFLRRPNGEGIINILIFAKLGRRGGRMGGAFGFRSNGLGSSPSQDLCCVLGQKYDSAEHSNVITMSFIVLLRSLSKYFSEVNVVVGIFLILP